ncbi:MAG: rod shape-determining protein [Actinomycetota bacterium]
MSRDLAIDLGTANTLVYRQGEGIVFNQPTVLAVDSKGTVLAMGEEAWKMMDHAPADVVAVQPLRDGTISEFDVLRRMIKTIFSRVGISRFPRPRVLVCVPSTITEVERRAVQDAAKSSGARSVVLVEEPLAAAIGAHLPVHEPVGNLIVDIGGGTSEMAVVSMGGVVDGRAVRTGGFDMDTAIQKQIHRVYGVAIGGKTAERVKIAVGSAYPAAGLPPVVISGRQISTGMPVEIEVTGEQIREALSETVVEIVAAARQCLAQAPPELTHDVLETGMFLCGGGALLRGMDMMLAQECEVPVHTAERPLETVVLGAGLMLEDLQAYQSTLLLERRR